MRHIRPRAGLGQNDTDMTLIKTLATDETRIGRVDGTLEGVIDRAVELRRQAGASCVGTRSKFLPILLVAALLTLLAAGSAAQDERRWKPLVEDGIHDPANPGLKDLHPPGEALSKLPASPSGNRVRWTEALKKDLIKPRAGVDPKSGTDATLHDSEILFNLNGSMRPVRFGHPEHTQLLDCTNCHEDLFKMEEGASKINKLRIQDGEQCGVCHTTVAFPLTDCKGCHNAPWNVKPAAKR